MMRHCHNEPNSFRDARQAHAISQARPARLGGLSAGRTWVRCLIVCLFCVGAGIWSDRAVSLNAAEYTDQQVKAAFLIRFESYVEWPAERFSQTNAPLVIGVLGNSGVAAELDKLRARKGILVSPK